MVKTIQRESKMGFDVVTFIWKISDFSYYDLRGGPIKSPLFKCFSTDFHMEVSYFSEKIRLRLVQSNSDHPPWITECKIGFCESDLNLSAIPSLRYYESFFAPVEDTDIYHDFDFDKTVEKSCLDPGDNVLTAQCIVRASQLKHIHHAQLVTPIVGDKKIFAKKGHAALAENIGTILEDSRFSDVALKVGEETFQAHKAILASRSKVFDGMFQSGMKESQENVVDIAEMKPAIVKEMLQYIYTGTIADLTMDAAIDLYVGADRYDLQELKEWCKGFILEHISARDVCRVAVTADLHSDEELAVASKHIFKKNLKMILPTETWRNFGKKNPTLQTELLQSALLSDD